MFIVSMTRATKNINIIEGEANVLKEMPFDFQALVNSTRSFWASDNEGIQGRLTEDKVSYPVTSNKSTDFNAQLMADFFTLAPMETMMPFYIPLPGQFPSKLKMNPEELVEPKTYQYSSLIGNRWVGRAFRVSSKAQATRTFISRVAVTKRMKITERMLERGLGNFEKMYLKSSWKMTEPGVAWNKAVDDLVQKYAAQMRLSDPKFKIDTRPGEAAGHLKTIVKTYINEPEKIMGGKAGQPIVAWAGAWNLLFGPFFRTISNMLQELLNDNTMFANGLDPDEFSAKMRALVKYCKGGLKNPRWECLDFEQYDASQNSSSINAEWALVKRTLCLVFGAGQEDTIKSLAQLFFYMKSNITVFCGSLIIDNEQKNTSGNPGTFLFNTLLQMLLWAAVMNPHRYGGGAFGGDDSTVCTNDDRSVIEDGFKQMNLSFKWDTNAMPMFFNHFINTDTGSIVYDPLRSLWALGSKNFLRSSEKETIKYIEEMKMAIHDKSKMWDLEKETVTIGLRYRHGLNDRQIDQLMELLTAFKSTPAVKIMPQLSKFEVMIEF